MSGKRAKEETVNGRFFCVYRLSFPCIEAGRWKTMSLGSSLYDARKKSGMSQQEVAEIQDAIDRTSEEACEKIDWTKAWSKKYPILASYRSEVDTEMYAAELKRLLDDLQKRYDYDELNALLVLKDILASVWKTGKKQAKRKNKRG